jgi:nicotinamidase-related amidase
LKARDVPVLYVNDNFGQWRSDWGQVYRACADENRRGAPLARLLKPEPDDYFVLKPRHSAFYCTSLDVLLAGFGTRRLILTGIAGNICVLFSANDAHMRNLEVHVPRDCIASNSRADNDWALRQMGTVLGIDIRASRSIRG